MNKFLLNYILIIMFFSINSSCNTTKTNNSTIKQTNENDEPIENDTLLGNEEEKEEIEETCISPCILRSEEDDQCKEWGLEICEVNLKCVPNCESRLADTNKCFIYREDRCFTNDSDDQLENCINPCIYRSESDGSCKEWGQKVCGINLSCTPNCETFDDTNNKCLLYKDDICTSENPELEEPEGANESDVE